MEIGLLILLIVFLVGMIIGHRRESDPGPIIIFQHDTRDQSASGFGCLLILIIVIIIAVVVGGNI